LPDAEHDLEFLTTALHEAGRVALSFHGHNPEHWVKPDGSIVTAGDLAVNESLLGALKAARPDDAILSEETPDNAARISSKRLWIIDPIDGTRNYFNGGTDWCIGVALIEDGQPKVSALYQPTEDRMYTAIRGQGAYRNNRRINTSPDVINVISPKSLQPAIAAASLKPQASASLALLLRFAAIAEGGMAGAISIGDKKDWDIAAGHLLLIEAGGVATTQAGAPFVYNRTNPWQPGVVAATSQHHATLLKIVGDM
jgi:myo-inositol-1(or 4)-monophosphatase